MKDISLPNRNNFRNKPGATGVSVNPLGAFMDTAVLLRGGGTHGIMGRRFPD